MHVAELSLKCENCRDQCPPFDSAYSCLFQDLCCGYQFDKRKAVLHRHLFKSGNCLDLKLDLLLEAPWRFDEMPEGNMISFVTLI